MFPLLGGARESQPLIQHAGEGSASLPGGPGHPCRECQARGVDGLALQGGVLCASHLAQSVSGTAGSAPSPPSSFLAPCGAVVGGLASNLVNLSNNPSSSTLTTPATTTATPGVAIRGYFSADWDELISDIVTFSNTSARHTEKKVWEWTY